MSDAIKVLLLEDDAADRLIFGKTLLRGGLERYDVRAVGRVSEVAAAVAQRAPDVVVLDLNLPDSRGFETYLKVRRCVGLAPTVVLTAVDDRDLGMRAIEHGAQDYLVKGEYTPGSLDRALRHAIARSRIVQEAASAALHDELTGLPNRALVEDRLVAAVRRAERRRERLAVLFVDLDRFKPVNDRYGHHVGDALLKAVSARIKDFLRASDTVARWGGDEFVCLLEPVMDLSTTRRVAGALHREVLRPVVLPEMGGGALELSTGASMGLALFPEHGHDAEELLQRSDEAMYAAKRAGGGCVVWGSEAMRALGGLTDSGVMLALGEAESAASRRSQLLKALGEGEGE